MNISFLRFLPAAVLISAGIAIMLVGTIGIFRIRYVLNRLHAAAMGDSLGLLLVVLGLVILYGWSFSSVKLLLIVALFWIASPVCSHLLAGLEVFTNDKLQEQCEMVTGPEGDEEKKEQTKGGMEQ